MGNRKSEALIKLVNLLLFIGTIISEQKIVLIIILSIWVGTLVIYMKDHDFTTTKIFCLVQIALIIMGIIKILLL